MYSGPKFSGRVYKCWEKYTPELLNWSRCTCRGQVICHVRPNNKEGFGMLQENTLVPSKMKNERKLFHQSYVSWTGLILPL